MFENQFLIYTSHKSFLKLSTNQILLTSYYIYDFCYCKRVPTEQMVSNRFMIFHSSVNLACIINVFKRKECEVLIVNTFKIFKYFNKVMR